jgi:uncharacterized protein YlxP (DUF503 family)
MFVGVARLSLQIPESGSLKAKRQVLRRVTDRVKSRFNVAVAEVEDQDAWQKATLALAVVGNDRRHVNEQLEKIIHAVEEMYVAPLISREMEILSFGEQLFGGGGPPAGAESHLPIDRGDRSLAEAEGLGAWPERPTRRGTARAPKSHEEARARARTLRNPRDWEKG